MELLSCPSWMMVISLIFACYWDVLAVVSSSSCFVSSASRKASKELSDFSAFWTFWHMSIVSTSSAEGGEDMYRHNPWTILTPRRKKETYETTYRKIQLVRRLTCGGRTDSDNSPGTGGFSSTPWRIPRTCSRISSSVKGCVPRRSLS